MRIDCIAPASFTPPAPCCQIVDVDVGAGVVFRRRRPFLRAGIMKALALLLALCSVAQTPALTPMIEGVRPVSADGRILNLDFETGTLADWTAEGDAFQGQPIQGDTVHPRRADSYSRHHGSF